jgi:hypothetical protein
MNIAMSFCKYIIIMALKMPNMAINQKIMRCIECGKKIIS